AAFTSTNCNSTSNPKTVSIVSAKKSVLSCPCRRGRPATRAASDAVRSTVTATTSTFRVRMISGPVGNAHSSSFVFRPNAAALHHLVQDVHQPEDAAAEHQQADHDHRDPEPEPRR